MLDGIARFDELFTEAARLGMPALAVTDHGNLFGAYEFWKTGTAFGVKPIIGMEAYFAPQGRATMAPFDFGGGFDEPGEDGGGSSGRGKQPYTHMTMWAENGDGLHNLFRLSSLSSEQGYYRKPRIDRELLATHGHGLITTTGCPSGEVNRWLQAGNYRQALATAADYRDIMGAQNVFVELMDHGLPVETSFRRDLLRLSADLGLGLVATNDLHYVAQQDAHAHDIALCIGTRAQVSDTKRFKFSNNEFYLKSSQQMRALFAELPAACDNTLAIAQRCTVSFDEGANWMPRFPVPAGETETSWLIRKVRAGLSTRLPSGVPAEYEQRARFEVDVISSMGFPGYFLVVADLVAHAKSVGIRVGPGRGSAAGSIVAWALGITELDPIRFGLMFERFLNPDRVSMPDIDIDFDERRRAEMITYACTKYGSDRVAQIITYSSIKAKAAIKDSARALGLPYSLGDSITKAMPAAVMGKELSLDAVSNPAHPRHDEAQDLRDLAACDPQVATVLDTARSVEGLKRQPGVHAAGVILSAVPLTDVIPLWTRQGDGATVTQFDMNACEALGLLKMDFLGLRNLTVLEDCLDNIATNHSQRIVLEDLPLDDSATFELLARGDTLGVFQLDGAPIRALLKAMEPDSFADISAVLALYRPGPMGANAHIDYANRKNGRAPVTPIHPELAEPLADILGETYGLIVYQEQVMAIAQTVAGYSLGQADLLRRAMGKKKKEILDLEYGRFRDGMINNGYSESAIATLWEILVPFSDYAFNKAHTAGYGMVSYWTAYMKANYPAEYMAALLTSIGDDKDKLAVYLHECRRIGLRVLPPDINQSGVTFTAHGTDVRFGLSAISNVGETAVIAITSNRPAEGYRDFFHVLHTTAGACNKRVTESLIKAGAFDSFGHSRAGLFAISADAVSAATAASKATAIGQFDLFATGTDVSYIATPIPDVQWDHRTQLGYEKDMLGLYVSDHPLAELRPRLAEHSTTTLADLADSPPPGGATIAGLITTVTRKTSKQGKPWAIVTIDDATAVTDVLFYPKTWALFSPLCTPDSILSIGLRIDHRDDSVRLVAADAYTPQLHPTPLQPWYLHLPLTSLTSPNVHRLKSILDRHPGTTPVIVHLPQAESGQQWWRLDACIKPNSALAAELVDLFGPHALEHLRDTDNTAAHTA